MLIVKLALKRLISKKVISLLLIFSIGLSSMLVLSVQKLNESAKNSFNTSISGTDLIVGTRSSRIQLLMYSIFRQGSPIANISYQSYEDLKNLPEIKWSIPLSLGDSHKGFVVLGTTLDYFKHYRYHQKKQIRFQRGSPFEDPYDIVLGATVAKTLGYSLGDSLFLAHGIAKSALRVHKNKAFRVVGILKATGTPIDQTLHVSLEGLEAVHNKNVRSPLKPKSITSFLLGLKSKFNLFSVQRHINEWKEEPLSAIIPGLALSQLWNTLSSVETAFVLITRLVILISFMTLLLALFMSLAQRKVELAIFRTLGAHPYQIASMLVIESLLISLSGILCGLLLSLGTTGLLKPILEQQCGLVMTLSFISKSDLLLLLSLVGLGVLVSLIPAYLAYKKSASEGFVSL